MTVPARIVTRLPKADSRILQICYGSLSLKEVVEAIGFEMPSSIGKCIEKVAERYEDFALDEYSEFLGKHCQ